MVNGKDAKCLPTLQKKMYCASHIIHCAPRHSVYFKTCNYMHLKLNSIFWISIVFSLLLHKQLSRDPLSLKMKKEIYKNALLLSVGLGKDFTAIGNIPLNTILQNKDMKSRFYLETFIDLGYGKCIFI